MFSVHRRSALAVRKQTGSIRVNSSSTGPNHLRSRVHCVTDNQRMEYSSSALGTIRPFVPQGNVRVSVLRGDQLFMLAMFRCCYPYAVGAEVKAFLFNMQPLGSR